MVTELLKFVFPIPFQELKLISIGAIILAKQTVSC